MNEVEIYKFRVCPILIQFITTRITYKKGLDRVKLHVIEFNLEMNEVEISKFLSL